jgi:2-polyprenyl-3-methyl-5-hydroxy-6-metoxy-1,4-benzoquinol methylase
VAPTAVLSPGAARAARGANIERYDDPAVTLSYAESPYHARRRELAGKLLVRTLASSGVPSGPVVEIGTGARSIVGSLPELDRPICLADSSPATLDVAAQGAMSVNLDVTTVLPFRDRSVAAVVATELIEHLFDPMSFLAELKRIVKVGGVVILTTPNLANLPDRIRFLFGAQPRQIDPTHDYLKLHIRQYTARLLRRMLADASFEVVAIRSNYVGFPVSSGRWVESKGLARIMPSVGGSLIIAARRRRRRPT